ncbi:MAG: formylglycine-generating enzyme family protein [Bacteroidales bacterium]
MMMKKLPFLVCVLFTTFSTHAFALEAKTPIQSQTITVKGVSFDMIKVEGGTFRMGCSIEQTNCDKNEMPSHSVTLSTYNIGKFEVTQKLWVAVMGKNPSGFKGDNLPVEQVSWNDCQEFIKALNKLSGKKFRLPTEAEWEFAARGGNHAKETKYAGSDSINEIAWHSDTTTHNVGTKQANELGIYDMSGNVWEWCNDWMNDYTRAAVTNPKGAEKGTDRILRGGHFVSTPAQCRVPTRNWRVPTFKNAVIGFRIVLEE